MELMTSLDVSGCGGGWGKPLKDKFNLSSVCIKKKEKKWVGRTKPGYRG